MIFPWERRLVRSIWAQNNVNKMLPVIAALSIARSNGKSVFASALAAACVAPDGPLNRAQGECNIVSRTFPQARHYIGRHVLYHMKPFFKEHGTGVTGRYKVGDTTNRFVIEDKETGSVLKCVAATPEVIMGAGGVLTLCDEVSSWKVSTLDALIAAIETGSGKEPGSVMLMTSTRSDEPSHPFELFLSKYADISMCYAVPKEEKDIYKKSVYLRANPSAKFIPELDASLKAAVAKAKESPASLASYRALKLNQGGSGVRGVHLMDPEEWRALEKEWDDREGMEGDYHLGVDAGYVSSMSSCVAYWPKSGRLSALALVGAEPDLLARGKNDNVGPLYQKMYNRGELYTNPGRVSDLSYMFSLVYENFGNPVSISADRWRMGEVLQALEGGILAPCAIRWRGQGYKDGSQDLNAFLTACLTDKVKPEQSLLMRSGFSVARMIQDVAGNRKLAKGGETPGRPNNKRDDVVAAAILAVSAGANQPVEDDRPIGVVTI